MRAACWAVLSVSLLFGYGTASADRPQRPSAAALDHCKDPNPVVILAASATRARGTPTTTSFSFAAATPLDVCIEVTSGGKQGAASAVVSLDSTALLSERDFSANFTEVERKRLLTAGPHTLQIKVASAPGTSIQVVISTHAVVGRPVVVLPDHHDTSPPLRTLKQLPPPSPPVEVDRPPSPTPRTTNPPDPVLQKKKGTGAIIGDFTVINGIPVSGGYPPDPNASIGGTQVVETVNSAYAVYHKTSGQLLLGPSGIATVWSGFGGPCESGFHSDPVVLFDKAAGRWLITVMGLGATLEECFAISTSADATGTYQRYSYPFATTPDFPKFGIWPDAYYTSYNNAGAWACAYNRTQMLAGAATPASVCFPKPAGTSVSQPSDLDGPTPPPAGEPNFFLGISSSFSLDRYKFHVDFASPESSSFTGPTSIPIAPFGASVYQVPQKGTSQLLTTGGWLVLPRVAYRNFGSHESLVVCHSADTGGGSTGFRWYEIRSPNAATPTVFQQGTYGPDSDNRFYCSAAMDGAGNIAVGYSVSSSSIYPAARFTGRFASDPLNTLRAESSIIEGGGYQSFVRWGDYVSMAIDPSDDRTFVYTNEYFPQAGGPSTTAGWATRMAVFTLDPFAATGSLGTPRFLPAVALLPTGKVLFAGGNNVGTTFTAVASAELYNPATGTFAPTGSMTAARVEPQAIVLPNGKVLVVGGYSAAGTVLASAELYDPATGTFTATGSMGTPRVAFGASLLPNGKVLIAGGSNNGIPSGNLASAELYDLTTGTFTPTGSMVAARTPYTAALLPNGKVLIAGGYGSTVGSVLASAELYDPASGTFAATGSMSTKRVGYAESLLPNGKVLIAGGFGTNKDVATAELYDPATDTFTATGSLGTARTDASAVWLTVNGKVLVAGGLHNNGYLTSAELYDPWAGTFTATGNMATGRASFGGALMANGSVLVAGGVSSGSTYLASAEIYAPYAGSFTATGAMSAARSSQTATLLPSGVVLVAGGFNGSALAGAEIYVPASGAFTATGSLIGARSSQTATVLRATGKLLMTGGAAGATLNTAELYQ